MQLRDYQIDLIKKTQLSFRSGHKRPLVVLPCGGGKTVCFAWMARRHIEKNLLNTVWFIVHREELIDQTIKTFERFDLDTNRIYINMVQYLHKHLDKYPQPSLIIIDEAHHAIANTWIKIIEEYPNVPVVGLTATPLRLSGEALGNVFDDLVEGVSSEYLLENGYLSPYEYYAPSNFNGIDVKIKRGDYDQEEVSDLLIRSRIYGDVEKYIDYNRKTIIYCPSIKFSKHLESKNPNIVHFDGSTPKNKRKQIISDFREGKIKILSNVDLIGEGFDVPDCDTIMLLRPTKAVGLYIQQSMRGLRIAPGKVAKIYDFVGNAYRHGLPTDDHEWSLFGKMKCANVSSEPDIIVRECKSCFRVYKGVGQICPYCGANNGLTKSQIQQQKSIELEQIKKIENSRKAFEQHSARTYAELVTLGKARGYKNPSAWAKNVLKSRNSKLNNI